MNYIIQRKPFVVPTTDGKYIAEHWGAATDKNSAMSIAHMVAPPMWTEEPQTPLFDEYTIVISGKQCVEIDGEKIIVNAGESIKVMRDTTVRYSNPFPEACIYVAVCTPAFTVDSAGR